MIIGLKPSFTKKEVDEMRIDDDFEKEQRILDNFFDEYVRPPKVKEFMKILNISSIYPITSYTRYLKKHGYRPYKNNAKTFEVVDTKDNLEKIIFVGIGDEVAEELTLERGSIPYYSRGNRLYHKRYIIREKIIDLDKNYC